MSETITRTARTKAAPSTTTTVWFSSSRRLPPRRAGVHRVPLEPFRCFPERHRGVRERSLAGGIFRACVEEPAHGPAEVSRRRRDLVNLRELRCGHETERMVAGDRRISSNTILEALPTTWMFHRSIPSAVRRSSASAARFDRVRRRIDPVSSQSFEARGDGAPEIARTSGSKRPAPRSRSAIPRTSGHAKDGSE